MTIDAAIQKAIQDNLPAATAGELKKYLEETENLKHNFKVLEAERDNLFEEHETASQKINQLNHLVATQEKLDKQKLELEEKERDQRVLTATLSADHHKARADEIFSLVSLIFKNSIVRRSLSGNVPVYTPPSPNCSYGSMGTSNMNTNETEEVE